MPFLIDLTASTSSSLSPTKSSTYSPNVPRSVNADFEAFKRSWRQRVDLSSDLSSSDATPKRPKKVPSSPLVLSETESVASIRRSPRLLSKLASHSFSAASHSPLQPTNSPIYSHSPLQRAADLLEQINESFAKLSQSSPGRRLSTSSADTIASPLRPLTVKNRLETITAVRLHMSKALKEQYFEEIERRFAARNMSECLQSTKAVTKRIPALASGCFRWSLPASKSGFLSHRLFLLDAEALWDDFIVKQRFSEVLQPFLGLEDCILYFCNWKRAVNKHTSQLNRLFRQAVMGTPSKPSTLSAPTAADLENEFFLQAADCGVKVNFSTATSEAQGLADLIDFVLEMTRVVAKTTWDRMNNTSHATNSQLTLPPDTKVKSGKDARDCWHKMLCQLPRVTPPVADALIQHFPTFKSLMRAVNSCGCDEDGQRLFEDLRLHEGEGKRIGPSIALRIYRYFKW